MSCFGGKMREYDLISIDRFDNYKGNDNLQSTVYFLSHFHTDHTVGLTSPRFVERLKSDRNVFLYCSEVTKILMLGHPSYEHLAEFVRTLECDVPCRVPVPDRYTNQVDHLTVTLIPASHCPGSVMFLFEGDEGTVLYSGDFRWEGSEVSRVPWFKSGDSVKDIQSLYVDTTFCIPEAFHIPSRGECADALYELVRDWLAESPNHMVHVTSNTRYGHEHLLKSVAERLNIQVHVSEEKFQLYEQISDLREVFTANPSETRFHACSKVTGRDCRSSLPCGYFKSGDGGDKVIVVRPSTMWFTQGVQVKDIYVKTQYLHRVCYSFHSSYSEVRDLVTYLKPRRVFPNVAPMKYTLSQVQIYLNNFLKLHHREHVKNHGGSPTKPLGILRKIKTIETQSGSLSDSEELCFGDSVTPVKRRRRTSSVSLPSSPGVKYSIKYSDFAVERTPENSQNKNSQDLSSKHSENESHSSYTPSRHSDSEMDLTADSDPCGSQGNQGEISGHLPQSLTYLSGDEDDEDYQEFVNENHLLHLPTSLECERTEHLTDYSSLNDDHQQEYAEENRDKGENSTRKALSYTNLVSDEKPAGNMFSTDLIPENPFPSDRNDLDDLDENLPENSETHFMDKSENEFDRVDDKSQNEFDKVDDERQNEFNKVGDDESKNDFDKVGDESQNEFDKVGDESQNEFDKFGDESQNEFDKVGDESQNEFDKVDDESKNEFDKVDDGSQNEFDKVDDESQNEFGKVGDESQNEFDKVADESENEFDKVGDESENEFDQVDADESQNEFDKVGDESQNDFDKVGDESQNEFDKVDDESQNEFDRVDGDSQNEFDKVDDDKIQNEFDKVDADESQNEFDKVDEESQNEFKLHETGENEFDEKSLNQFDEKSQNEFDDNSQNEFDELDLDEESQNEFNVHETGENEFDEKSLNQFDEKSQNEFDDNSQNEFDELDLKFDELGESSPNELDKVDENSQNKFGELLESSQNEFDELDETDQNQFDKLDVKNQNESDNRDELIPNRLPKVDETSQNNFDEKAFDELSLDELDNFDELSDDDFDEADEAYLDELDEGGERKVHNTSEGESKSNDSINLHLSLETSDETLPENKPESNIRLTDKTGCEQTGQSRSPNASGVNTANKTCTVATGIGKATEGNLLSCNPEVKGQVVEARSISSNTAAPTEPGHPSWEDDQAFLDEVEFFDDDDEEDFLEGEDISDMDDFDLEDSNVEDQQNAKQNTENVTESHLDNPQNDGSTNSDQSLQPPSNTDSERLGLVDPNVGGLGEASPNPGCEDLTSKAVSRIQALEQHQQNSNSSQLPVNPEDNLTSVSKSAQNESVNNPTNQTFSKSCADKNEPQENIHAEQETLSQIPDHNDTVMETKSAITCSKVSPSCTKEWVKTPDVAGNSMDVKDSSASLDASIGSDKESNNFTKLKEVDKKSGLLATAVNTMDAPIGSMGIISVRSLAPSSEAEPNSQSFMAGLMDGEEMRDISADETKVVNISDDSDETLPPVVEEKLVNDSEDNDSDIEIVYTSFPSESTDKLAKDTSCLSNTTGDSVNRICHTGYPSEKIGRDLKRHADTSSEPLSQLKYAKIRKELLLRAGSIKISPILEKLTSPKKVQVIDLTLEDSDFEDDDDPSSPVSEDDPPLDDSFRENILSGVND